MKVLAPFDGRPFAEATLPLLARISAIPSAEFFLLAVAQEPSGRLQHGARKTIIGGEVFGSTMPLVVAATEPKFAETKEQAFERRIAELEDYLATVASRLPKGATAHIEAHVANDPARVIIDVARQEAVDLIVMATRSRTGVAHLLFGSTTEAVVRSGAAPVLVVHPTEANR